MKWDLKGSVHVDIDILCQRGTISRNLKHLNGVKCNINIILPPVQHLGFHAEYSKKKNCNVKITGSQPRPRLLSWFKTYS